MPGYVSHTIMARDVYNKLRIKNIDVDYMITYSLGGDLCKYAACRKDSHYIKQDEFIYKMCDYIKYNNLYNDKKIMGVLYGHICHLVMDKVIHPYVYKLENRCNYVGYKNHTLIEGYMDSYFIRYKYNIVIDKYVDKILLINDKNKDVFRMINYIYQEVYNTKNVSIYYKFNLFLYRNIKFLYKIFGVKLLMKICKYDKFMDENKDVFKMDSTKKYNNISDELIKLYNKSIVDAVEYIDKVNKYIEKR